MLTKAEQRVLVWLEAGDFDNTGCRHGQETIAVGAQCTVRTVIRATKRLRDLGLITINKERRPGCKWLCNVYHVRHWNPRKRSGVLNILAARREAKCHAEGKATASRAQTSAVNPSFVASKALPGRSRLRASRDFELRRSSRMDQRRRPQHITVVPDLTCPRCQELARELEAKTEIVRKLSVSNTELAEELSGAMEAARATGKENANLKRARTKAAKESAKAEQIEQVIEHWKKHRPKTTAVFGEPGSKSYEVIDKALSLMAKDPAGPVEACCEAIDGLHIAPWEAYGRRYREAGKGRTLRNSVDYALGDELRIEKCRSIVRWVRGDGADRAWELAQVAEATYWALTELTQERIRERRRGPVEPEPERFTVEGIRVRSDGR